MGLPENRLPEFSLTSKETAATAAITGEDPGTVAHMRNWMECVRSRQAPRADVQAGYNHSVALCMTIAARQTGKRVAFDDARQEVVTA